MNVLIGCEESQAVCIEFRKLGHNAYSCDLQPCSGGHPEWHLQIDIFEAINLKKWDLAIFFPPCTHLAVSGAPSFEQKRKDGRQQSGIDFFLKIVNCGIPKTAIENPIGIMSTIYKKPDQIINPYYFGDPYPKKTCLWLKNLPKLIHIKQPDLFNDSATWVNPHYKIYNSKKTKSGVSKYSPKHGVLGKRKRKGKERSKTEPGLALAMAQQWG